MGNTVPQQTIAQPLDATRFLGKWHEIAAMPAWFSRKCKGGETTAEYFLSDNGRDIDIRNSCTKANGDRSYSFGVGRLDESKGNGRMKVTFFTPLDLPIFFGGANYWILDTDYDDYALVGSPKQNYLWILSRTPAMSMEKLKTLKAKIPARTPTVDSGYDLSNVFLTQKNGFGQTLASI